MPSHPLATSVFVTVITWGAYSVGLIALVCLASHPARSPLQHCGARRILNRPGVSLPLARIRGGGHPRSGGRPPRRQLPCGSHRTGCGDHRSGGLTGAVRSIEPTRLSSYLHLVDSPPNFICSGSSCLVSAPSARPVSGIASLHLAGTLLLSIHLATPWLTSS